MKIINLTESSNVYTSNAFLVLGSWNALPDVNTLVDVGRDPTIVETIYTTSTGVGKKRVDQVVLTHSHYDHAGLLATIREQFNPVIYAFSPYLEHVNHTVQDGDTLKFGDRIFEVIHTPGHSHDSICLYCEEENILFAGDTPLIIHRPGDTYQEEFILALEKVGQRNVQKIYFGHGPPIIENCNARIRRSIENVKKSVKILM